MSGMIKWLGLPAPCPEPGAPPLEVDGCPGCARANWAGELLTLDLNTWKMAREKGRGGV